MAHVDRIGNRWASGPHYGPVLSPIELYLLDINLEIHPILQRQADEFEMLFNIMSGQTGGTNGNREDLPFVAKDEPAVLPRMTEIILLTKASPWITTIRNEKGVTLADLCSQLWKDYSEHAVTDTEFASLPPRLQDLVRRQAGMNQHALAGVMSNTRARNVVRSDWFRERQWFETMHHDDRYVKDRLGYSAPHIFVFETTQ